MRFVSGRLLALGLVSSMLVSAAACSSKDEPAAVKTDDTTQKVKSVEGRAHIEGEITKMVAVAASFDAINPPFTIEIPEVGRGGPARSREGVGAFAAAAQPRTRIKFSCATDATSVPSSP